MTAPIRVITYLQHPAPVAFRAVQIDEYEWRLPEDSSVTDALDILVREPVPLALARRRHISSAEHWLLVCLHAVARAYATDWHTILDAWWQLQGGRARVVGEGIAQRLNQGQL